MIRILGRIVPAKKRKKLNFQVGSAYDIDGRVMVVSTVSRGTEDIGILLVPVESYRRMQREGLTYDYRRQS